MTRDYTESRNPAEPITRCLDRDFVIQSLDIRINPEVGGYGVNTRRVPGHEFGLKLSSEDKAALISLLKTL